MTTGNHTVRDIYCCKCGTTLGWKYVNNILDTIHFRFSQSMYRTRRMSRLRSTKKANISLNVIYSWTCSRYCAQPPTVARLFTTTSMYHRKGKGCRRRPFSGERFPNNTHCTTTYRRPVFNFVPCSLIFPGQQLIRHGTQRRTCWTVPFLARPPYPPLDLLIYIASSIDNFSFKKRIDSSFNRHLLRNFLSFDHFTATTTITSFPISLAI